MTYMQVVGKIREATRRKVMAAWRMYGVGTINRDQFQQLAAAILGQSGAQAASAADMTVSIEMTRINRRMELLAGVENRKTNYLDSIATVLDGEDGGDVLMKLERLSLNAPLDAAQNAYSDALAQSSASGWVRQLDANPCQLCRWWWREGRVWPADHQMPTHPGCECIPVPVVTDRKIQKVSY